MHKKIPLSYIVACCSLMLLLQEGRAQVNNTLTANPATGYTAIDILYAGKLGNKNEYRYAVGAVKMRQGVTLFYCDSVSLNTVTGVMEAFGRVHINDNDSIHTYANFLRYQGKERTAYLQGNVKLTDGRGTLTTEQLDYDMNTRVGLYEKNGKLVNGKTVLTSKKGVYYGDTKDVTFIQNVLLTDPQYKIKTDSLLFNTSTGVATFVVPTDIRSGDQRSITTSDGSYNMNTRQAYFGNRSVVVDSTTSLVADEIAYDDKSGFGEARGQVVLKDTTQGIIVIANNIKTNRKESAFLATESPMGIIIKEGDSTYISGDTIYSARLSDRIEAQKASASKAVSVDSVAVSEQLEKIPALEETPLSNNMDEPLQKKQDKPQPERISSSIIVPAKKEAQQKNKGVTTKTVGNTKDKLLIQSVKKSDSLILPIDTLNRRGGKYTPSIITQNQKSQVDSSVSRSSFLNFSVVSEDSSPQEEKKEDRKNRFLEVYYNVKIYNDSMQAVCDSMFYSSQDSVFRLLKSPKVWMTGSNQLTQMTGDTIFVFTKNRKPQKVDIWKNAMVLGQPYQDSSQILTDYYNQLAGNYIYAYLTNGEIDSMRAKYNAESVYYIVDERNRFVGVNKLKSDVLDFYFQKRSLEKVIGRKDVEGTTYPMGQVNHTDIRLRSFMLHMNLRPRSKYDLIAPPVKELQPKNISEMSNVSSASEVTSSDN